MEKSKKEFPIREFFNSAFDLVKKNFAYSLFVGILEFLSFLGFFIFLQVSMLQFAFSLVDKKKEGNFNLLIPTLRTWVRCMGATIIVNILTFLGFLFFFIPGFMISTRYFLVDLVIIDKHLAIEDALVYSSHLTKNVRFKIFLYILLSWLFQFPGLYLISLGTQLNFFPVRSFGYIILLFTMSMMVYARIYMYRFLSLFIEHKAPAIADAS